MSQILTEISQIKYLFGYKRGIVISEQPVFEPPAELVKQINDLNKNKSLKIVYNKCAGGLGNVNRDFVDFLTINTNDGPLTLIKFKVEPNQSVDGKITNVNDPNDKEDSLTTCLGQDEPMASGDVCFEVEKQSDGSYMATIRRNCKTGQYI